jgi:hypothetical protein
VILVDTSVLVDYLRGKDTPAVRRLRGLDSGDGTFGIPGPCVQELLQGARDEGDWRRLRAVLLVQEVVLPDDPLATHVDAARIYFDCRRKGLTVRSSADCFIAAVALSRGEPLLHDDEDFETIRKVRPLRTLRG